MKTDKHALIDNNGFSLIELIVSILIMSVISGMIIVLISFSRNTYNLVNTESQLQGEAEIAKRFISELAVETKMCDSGSYGNDTYIYIVAPDNEQITVADEHYSVYFILREKDTNILRYGKMSYSDFSARIEAGKTISDIISALGIKGDKYALLAEHFTDISLEKAANSSLITVSMTLFYNNNTYITKLNLDGRNII